LGGERAARVRCDGKVSGARTQNAAHFNTPPADFDCGNSLGRRSLDEDRRFRPVKIGVVDVLPDLTHHTLKTAAIEILGAMIPEDNSAPDSHGLAFAASYLAGDPVAGVAQGCSGLVLPIFSLKREPKDVRTQRRN
jgi:hypothetical protein